MSAALDQHPPAAPEQLRKDMVAALYYVTLAALNLALLAVALAVGP